MGKIKYNPLLKYGFQELDSGNGGGGSVDVIDIITKEVESRSSKYTCFFNEGQGLVQLERFDVIEDLSCVYFWVEFVALKKIEISGDDSFPEGRVFSLEKPSDGVALVLPECSVSVTVRDSLKNTIHSNIKAFYDGRFLQVYDMEAIAEGSFLLFCGVTNGKSSFVS